MQPKGASVPYLSPDSLDVQEFNLYQYVQNDPINFIDPEGLLRYNKPAPTTVPPPFPVRIRLHCMELCLLRNLGISGGAETSGHSNDPPSRHYFGQAADISYRMNPGLKKDINKALCCALRCGFKFALEEGDHLHVQTVRGRGGSRGDLPTLCECIRYIVWPF